MCPAETGAEPEVGQLDVSVGVYEYVVGLNVPVNEAHLVDAVHSTHQLRDIEPTREQNIGTVL